MFSLFLPERCVHCEEPTARALDPKTKEPFSHYLCDVCLRILSHQETPEEQTIRDEFGKLGKGIELAHCRAAYTFIAGSPIQSVVHSFKYDGMVKLAAQFGKSISFLTPHEVDVIIPVPLHRTRLAERGYNQAEAIAKAIASQTKANVVQAAKRARPTPSQTNLPLQKRIENMREAFALTRRAEEIKGKNILIVDDVMTTGSTLASVAETLLEAKPKSISTLALAIAEHTI
jgi:competence protein ComFC